MEYSIQELTKTVCVEYDPPPQIQILQMIWIRIQNTEV